MSRGNRKVKVYNWLTGKVEFLLGGGEDFKFDYLVVSKLILVKSENELSDISPYGYDIGV